ncbi:hypothetical protein PR048_007530 [Dryococelus australis]|uniref:Uncharacterized protein n=1 Tax=Dryococelus australis TaxID=614101 RepID=A0ABQ9HUG9_9NEOP|nr:hypothetical protein PR048_007530 [Dryococelus australis]
MATKNTGLVGLLRKMMSMCLYCIALFIKKLSSNHVMKDVTRIINLNRNGNRAQSHRKLVEFFKELSVQFHDFLDTAGKSEYDYLEKLQNEERLCLLVFLTDITEHLVNILLDVKLQGEKQNICQLMSHIEAFRKKIKTIFQLVADPVAVTIEDQDPELQMELCELQSDILLLF